MTRINKYLYGWNLWTNYGYGWEIECCYLRPEETKADARRDAKEYRLAGATVRLTKTRKLNPAYQQTAAAQAERHALATLFRNKTPVTFPTIARARQAIGKLTPAPADCAYEETMLCGFVGFSIMRRSLEPYQPGKTRTVRDAILLQDGTWS